jgi:hypothetical protein
VEPVRSGSKGNGAEGTGTRAVAIVTGAAMMFAGLVALVTFVGIGEGDQGLHYHWLAWIFGLISSSFLVLPIVVPGAFLIMRGIRGGPFVLQSSARRTVRRGGRLTTLLGVAAFFAGLVMGDDNPAQGAVIFLSLNLMMIGVMTSLIAFAGRPKRTDDQAVLGAGAADNRAGTSYVLPGPYERATTISDADNRSTPG